MKVPIGNMNDNMLCGTWGESRTLPKAVIFPARKIKPSTAKSVIDKISSVLLHQNMQKLCKQNCVAYGLSDKIKHKLLPTELVLVRGTLTVRQAFEERPRSWSFSALFSWGTTMNEVVLRSPAVRVTPVKFTNWVFDSWFLVSESSDLKEV